MTLQKQSTAEKNPRWYFLLLLILAGESVFILPFVLPRVFRPTVLETYALDNGSWREIGRYADHARVCAPPFDALEIELRALWGESE